MRCVESYERFGRGRGDVRRVRPVPPPPAALRDGDSVGAKERAAAIAHFGSADWQIMESAEATRFKFTAHKANGVKEALEAAFHGLCAYCEAPYSAVSPVDIEHYRPKAALDTPTQANQRPGYYWLASSWENLLPSCRRCNTAEWYEQPDGMRRKSGKGNSFPLRDEATRARRPGEEIHEQPLLVHPYFDNPDHHLEFVDELIRARDGDQRGQVTIDVLGLNRPGLLQVRRDRLVPLKTALKRMSRARQRVMEKPDIAEFRTDLEEAKAEIAEMLASGKPFSALVANYIGIADTDD